MLHPKPVSSFHVTAPTLHQTPPRPQHSPIVLFSIALRLPPSPRSSMLLYAPPKSFPPKIHIPPPKTTTHKGHGESPASPRPSATVVYRAKVSWLLHNNAKVSHNCLQWLPLSTAAFFPSPWDLVAKEPDNVVMAEGSSGQMHKKTVSLPHSHTFHMSMRSQTKHDLRIHVAQTPQDIPICLFS